MVANSALSPSAIVGCVRMASEQRVRQPAENRSLHRSHHLTGLSAYAPMSIVIGPVTSPNSAAWWSKSATLALQISFLLGRQLTFGQEPPIHRRSTTAVRHPDPAKCQARCLPPLPLPRTRTSYCSGRGMLNLPCPRLTGDENGHVAQHHDFDLPGGLRAGAARPARDPSSHLAS